MDHLFSWVQCAVKEISFVRGSAVLTKASVNCRGSAINRKCAIPAVASSFCSHLISLAATKLGLICKCQCARDILTREPICATPLTGWFVIITY